MGVKSGGLDRRMVGAAGKGGGEECRWADLVVGGLASAGELKM